LTADFLKLALCIARGEEHYTQLIMIFDTCLLLFELTGTYYGAKIKRLQIMVQKLAGAYYGKKLTVRKLTGDYYGAEIERFVRAYLLRFACDPRELLVASRFPVWRRGLPSTIITPPGVARCAI